MGFLSRIEWNYSLCFSLSKELDVEPMAVREETALENDVSYDGSLGRASLNRPIQSLNAPRSVSAAG